MVLSPLVPAPGAAAVGHAERRDEGDPLRRARRRHAVGFEVLYLARRERREARRERVVRRHGERRRHVHERPPVRAQPLRERAIGGSLDRHRLRVRRLAANHGRLGEHDPARHGHRADRHRPVVRPARPHEHHPPRPERHEPRRRPGRGHRQPDADRLRNHIVSPKRTTQPLAERRAERGELGRKRGEDEEIARRAHAMGR